MDKSSPKLNEAVVRVIALGDVVDVAFTSLEIWQQLNIPSLLVDVEEVLGDLVEKKTIVSYRGRYALCGRGMLFAERARRYRASVSKWRRARLLLTVLAAFPGVSAVGFYNALGYGNARVGSDIDIVVIVKRHWIWRTRLMSVVCAELFGHRPRQGRIRDGFCLSFFFTSDADLSQVKQPQDPFLSWWLTRMSILIDHDGAYETWFRHNAWIHGERPNVDRVLPVEFLNQRAVSVLRHVFRIICAPFFLVSDHGIKTISRFFGSPLLWRASEDVHTSVVMQDDLLKLHLTDRRSVHAAEFERRVAKALKHCSV